MQASDKVSMNFLSSSQAEKIILQSVRPLPVISVSLENSLGRILAENVYADRDQPSTDRSSMDGIAIASASIQNLKNGLRIAGTQKAGIPPQTLKGKGSCFEIMTGAVMPRGCDCVIPIENVVIKNQDVHLNPKTKIKVGQFIRKQGSEYQKGTCLLVKNKTIDPNGIALLGSVGKHQVKIYSPHIAVIGTGDELVEIAKAVQPYQSRRSNAYAVEAMLKKFGFIDVKRFHFNDNLPELRKGLKKILADFDMMILSGGVSMGKFDLIPQALSELGVNVVFHKVNQKPGKPFWYGLTKDKKPVFALPGNPVSTMVCAYRYILPYLKKAVGLNLEPHFVILSESISAHDKLTLFIPVKLSQNSKTQTYAKRVQFAGSGDYAALANADGFVEIPAQKSALIKGKRVRFFRW